MSKLFHITLTQGRADTLTLEADSKADVVNFFTPITTAVISNIKEIVFSKEHNINYVQQTIEETSSFKSVTVLSFSNSYAETFEFFNVKHSVTKQDIINQMKNLFILNEPIIDIGSLTFYD